jgi:EF hand
MKLISVLAVSAVALAACASDPRGGRPPGGPGGPSGMGGQLQESMIARPVALLFVGFDTNGDLATSADEFAAGLKAEFARADVNKDGFISNFEMIDWSVAVMGDKEALPDYRTMNADLGQSVSPDEFNKAFQREFTAMDKDGNGRLTRTELLRMAPQMGGFGGGGPPGGGQMRRGGGGGRGPGGGGPPGGGGGPY